MRKAGAAKALLDALQREPEPCTAVVPAQPELVPEIKEVAIADWNVDMYGSETETFVNVDLSDMTAMGDSFQQFGAGAASLAAQMASAGAAMSGVAGAVVGGVMGSLIGTFARPRRPFSNGYTREFVVRIVWIEKRKFERTFERIVNPKGDVVDEKLVEERELAAPTDVQELLASEREELLRQQAAFALNKPVNPLQDPERDLLYMAMNYAPELLEIARRDTERYDVHEDHPGQSYRIRDLRTGSTVVVSMRAAHARRR